MKLKFETTSQEQKRLLINTLVLLCNTIDKVDVDSLMFDESEIYVYFNSETHSSKHCIVCINDEMFFKFKAYDFMLIDTEDFLIDTLQTFASIIINKRLKD